MSSSVVFGDPEYEVIDGDRVQRRADAPPIPEDQVMSSQTSLLEHIVTYVQARIKDDYNFTEIWIPNDEMEPNCSVLASPDWDVAEKLLVIAQNAVGSQLGIWSRTLCLESGLRAGSMLPYISQAIEGGYGVLILRPNANSAYMPDEEGVERKVFIDGSSSPEEHVLFVWDNIIPDAQARKILLLGYGNGAILCKDILQRQIVQHSQALVELRIAGICTIEASQILENDDADDVKAFLSTKTINFEASRAPMAYRLTDRADRLGCVCVSVGHPSSDDIANVAWSVNASQQFVFGFLDRAGSADVSSNTSLALPFAKQLATDSGVDPNIAEASSSLPTDQPSTAEGKESVGFFARLFGRKGSSVTNANSSPSPTNTPGSSSKEEEDDDSDPNAMQLGSKGSRLSVEDFDLLKVVGKGAFGKVMLVRKKSGMGEGNIYAMKVLKKSVIVAKGQVEHTKSERSILMEIKHPFVVRLRFAFQSEEKLYLVTDYYSGGSLFYHLRKSRSFSEERARLYAAELLTALAHLHDQHIIYRDLKLENVLMDSEGHIALTDFGLSKQNIDMTGGATTFCGTAEYIAPELLKGQKYGAAVDWWSFGILLYEMMCGRTPFYDKNRKLMFYKIINTAPQFPPHFSEEACDLIVRLLNPAPAERLGSGDNGSDDIISSDFFAPLDFDALLRKEIVPSFRPDVRDEQDTKYVPKAYLNAEAKDSMVDAKEQQVVGATQFDAFTYTGESKLGGDDDDENMEEK